MALGGHVVGLPLKTMRVIVKPNYRDGFEVPVITREYPEGVVRYFGSRTAIAELRDLPITVRMPFVVINDRIFWASPKLERERLIMALRKLTAASQSNAASGPGLADANDWPELLAYLTETKYPTGEAREPSCLIIVADTSGWRGCVSDKDNARTLWKTAPSIDDLLNALEQALAEDDPTAWRQAAKARSGKRK